MGKKGNQITAFFIIYNSDNSHSVSFSAPLTHPFLYMSCLMVLAERLWCSYQCERKDGTSRVGMAEL